MSLTDAIHIGGSGLTASQLGIQVAGNNISNASTAGYSRQVASFTPVAGQRFGNVTLGRGVQVGAVRRQIDEALQSRLNNSVSDESAANQRSQIFSSIESALGELSDYSVSKGLTSFFNSWSERANLSGSAASVVQQGQQLAATIQRQYKALTNVKSTIDTQLSSAVDQANQYMQQIADLNGQIATAEVGGSTANSLRDQRDSAVKSLSELMDVSVVDHGSQGVDLLVGSTPIVSGTRSRGLELHSETDSAGITQVTIVASDIHEEITPSSGAIGALLDARSSGIDQAMNGLDTLASQVIDQVNRLHSTGVNAKGYTSLSGTLSVPTTEANKAIDDPTNSVFSKLKIKPQSGGFEIVVKNDSTGQTQTVRVAVDLDGITNAATAGTADDTSVASIVAGINGAAGVTASIGPDGTMQVKAGTGFSFSFQNDTSGVLSALGMNTFFGGTGAADMAVRSSISADPTQMATGRYDSTGAFVENATALKVAGLTSTGVDALGGRSLKQYWTDTATTVGGQTQKAQTEASAAGVVRQSLESQRDAISGVAIDEESINLITFQQQYQGSARVISIADELMKSLMQLV